MVNIALALLKPVGHLAVSTLGTQGRLVQTSSSSMSTARSAMDLVVFRSSRSDLGGALDMGELEALGAPNPF